MVIPNGTLATKYSEEDNGTGAWIDQRRFFSGLSTQIEIAEPAEGSYMLTNRKSQLRSILHGIGRFLWDGRTCHAIMVT